MAVQDTLLETIIEFATGLLPGTKELVPISADPLQTDTSRDFFAQEEDKETVLLVGPDLWQVLAAEDGNKMEKENAEKFAADPEKYRSLAKGEIRNLAKVLEDQGYNVVVLDAELETVEGGKVNAAPLYDKVYIRDSIERLSFSFINAEGNIEKIADSDTLIPLNMQKQDRRAEPREVVRQLLDAGIINHFIGPIIKKGDNAGDIDFNAESISPFDSAKNEFVEGGDFKYIQRYNRYVAGYGDRNTAEGLDKLQELTGVPVYKYQLKTDGAHFHIDVTARILENSGVLIVDQNGFANDDEYNRFIDEQLLEHLPKPPQDLDADGNFIKEVRDALVERYVIHLSEQDAEAYATNFVQLNNGSLLLPDGVSEEFIAELKAKDASFADHNDKNGLQPSKVIKVPMETLLMAGGAVHCTTNTEASVLFGGKITHLEKIKQYKTLAQDIADKELNVDPMVSVNFLAHSDVFYKNPIAAKSNSYQQDIEQSLEESSQLAFAELDNQREAQTQRHVLNLSFKAPDGKPDAIFPNNSVVVRYVDGQMKALLCPMSPGRQNELPPEYMNFLKEICGEENILDLRGMQPHHLDPREEGKCFEGTGVINFDEDGHMFVNKSYRSDPAFFKAAQTHFKAPELYPYTAYTKDGDVVYHANVVQFIGSKVAATCRASIPEGPEKEKLDSRLQEYADKGKLVLDLTHKQIDALTGNAIESINANGEEVLLISDTAFNALAKAQQQNIISVYGPDNIIQEDDDKFGVKLPVTQDAGGGGIRCTNLQINVPKSIALKIADAYATHLGHLSLGFTPTQQGMFEDSKNIGPNTFEEQFYATASVQNA